MGQVGKGALVHVKDLTRIEQVGKGASGQSRPDTKVAPSAPPLTRIPSAESNRKSNQQVDRRNSTERGRARGYTGVRP